MINPVFCERFKKAIDYWGQDSFTEAYVERADSRTRDLSFDEMNLLCELLIDNCERAPSIVKLVAFASIVRARRAPKPLQDVIGEVDCQSCSDLGVVRVKSDKHDFLMRCENIKCRPSYYWELPRWSGLYSDVFKREKCPAEWFKPSAGGVQFEKMQSWRAKIKISEVALASMGYDCETSSKPPDPS